MLDRNQISADAVKARADLLAEVAEVVELHRRGRKWWGKCPFHNDTNPSFYVDPENKGGRWHCFGCGKDGDVIDFIELYYHVTFNEAVEMLMGHRGQPLVVARPLPALPPANPREAENKRRAWELNIEKLQAFGGSPAEAYLASRGIPSAVALASGVQFHPDWHRWYVDENTGELKKSTRPARPAAMFPIIDQHGSLLAMQGRYIDGGEPRMRTGQPVEGAAKHGVFATAGALDQPTIIIVEGLVNALSFATCGIPAIATCGASHFPGWLPDAFRGRRVVTAFDPDDGGTQGMGKLANYFKQHDVESENLPITRADLDWNDILRKHGADALAAVLRHRLGIEPLPAQTGGMSPIAKVGDSVVDLHGHWRGVLTAVHPPCDECLAGWVEVETDEGEYGTADMRSVCDAAGILLAAPIYTKEELARYGVSYT
ncbi:MAG: CHC2 zinc finger domain-containing protein [Armatimonadota bacterium]